MGKKTLEGKVALVTGGSKGIGFSIATSLAKEGVSVVLVARTRPDLEKAYHTLVDKFGGDHLYIPADVGDATQVRTVVARTLDHYGHIDILVNNAGSFQLDDIDHLSLEKIENTIKTNLLGVLYFYHEVVPLFKRQSSGIIIDVISQAAHRIFDRNEAYGASKFGHRAASLSLELRLPAGVVVYRLYPGRVRTSQWEVDDSELKRAIRESGGPVIEPDQIGEYVADILTGRKLADTRDVLLQANHDGSMNELYLRKNALEVQ